MNQQLIDKLLHKAGARFGAEGIDYSSFTSSKFAELIINECIQVCADRGKYHDGLYSAWANDCSKRIGKHFGIEE